MTDRSATPDSLVDTTGPAQPIDIDRPGRAEPKTPPVRGDKNQEPHGETDAELASREKRNEQEMPRDGDDAFGVEGGR